MYGDSAWSVASPALVQFDAEAVGGGSGPGLPVRVLRVVRARCWRAELPQLLRLDVKARKKRFTGYSISQIYLEATPPSLPL